MSEHNEPKLSLSYGWDFGESGWNTKIDDNFIKIAALYSMEVLSDSTTTPPGGESEGDMYLLPTSCTGAWDGHDGELAYYVNSTYVFYTPIAGMIIRVVDKNKVCRWYDGANWKDELRMPDGGHFVLGTGTGTKIGTSTSQKLSFFNATPIVQPASADQASITPGTSTLTETQTLVQEMRDVLVDLGLMKGST